MYIGIYAYLKIAAVVFRLDVISGEGQLAMVSDPFRISHFKSETARSLLRSGQASSSLSAYVVDRRREINCDLELD